MEAVSTDDVYDIVDQCLDEDDLVPLIRLVFDTPARNLQAVGPQLGDTQSLTTSIDAGESVTYREELLELVMDILQRTAKEAQGVMERISSQHAADISGALSALPTLTARTRALQHRAREAASALRSLEPGLQALGRQAGRLSLARRNLALTRRVLNVLRGALTLCARAQAALGEGALHRAHCLTLECRRQYSWLLLSEKGASLGWQAAAEKENVPAESASPSPPAATPSPESPLADDFAAASEDDGAGMGAALGLVRPLLARALAGLEEGLLRAARGACDAWLLEARTACAAAGRAAMEAVAEGRRAQERTTDAREEFVGRVERWLERREDALEVAWERGGSGGWEGDAEGWESLALTEPSHDGGSSPSSSAPCRERDAALPSSSNLLRTLFAMRQLGREQELAAYVAEARRGQLEAELAALQGSDRRDASVDSAQASAHAQPHAQPHAHPRALAARLERVVGHFCAEARLRERCPPLARGSEAGWAAAAGALGGALQAAARAEGAEPEDLLALRERALLALAALRERGFPVGALREGLAPLLDAYVSAAVERGAEEARRALESAPPEGGPRGLLVDSQELAHKLFEQLRLCPTLADGGEREAQRHGEAGAEASPEASPSRDVLEPSRPQPSRRSSEEEPGLGLPRGPHRPAALPTPPFFAPFSAAVPAALRAVAETSCDTRLFARDVLSSTDAAAAAAAASLSLLRRALFVQGARYGPLRALEDAVAARRGATERACAALQALADACALQQALDAGWAPGAAVAPAAEAAVGELLGASLGVLARGLVELDWCRPWEKKGLEGGGKLGGEGTRAESPLTLSHPAARMLSLLTQAFESPAGRALPASLARRVLRRALADLARAVRSALEADAVPAVSAGGMRALAADLGALRAAAARLGRQESDGPTPLDAPLRLAELFCRPGALEAFVAAQEASAMSAPDAVEDAFEGLDRRTVAALLSKYREVRGEAREDGGAPGQRPLPKKEADVALRRLRAVAKKAASAG